MLGPRLDRPSAVGDEGRPRATSLTITAVLVVGLLVAAGVLIGTPFRFTSAALLVGLMTAGLALLDRDRLGATVIGHLCFLPAAVVVTLLLTTATLFSGGLGQGLLIGGALLSMVGVSAGWTDVFDSETLTNGLISSGIAYVAWLCSLVVLFGLALLAVVGQVLLDLLTGGAGPLVALLGLLVLGAVAAGCLYVAVRAIPAIQLTPVHRRESARARYQLLRTRLIYIAGGLCVAAAALFVVAVFGLLGPIFAVLGDAISGLAALSAVPLSLVASLSLLIALLAWGTRRLTENRDEVSIRTAGAVIAGACYAVAMLVSAPVLGLIAVTRGVFAGVLAVAPLVVYLLLGTVLVAVHFDVVPERAGPSALTAAGLILLGAGGALVGYPSVFVFAAVASGLIAWDVGTFGLGVTAELGHLPATRRLELYHGVFAVGVGLVGVTLLTIVDLARRSVAAGIGTPAAMGVAVLGAILLALPLRG